MYVTLDRERLASLKSQRDVAESILGRHFYDWWNQGTFAANVEDSTIDTIIDGIRARMREHTHLPLFNAILDEINTPRPSIEREEWAFMVSKAVNDTIKDAEMVLRTLDRNTMSSHKAASIAVFGVEGALDDLIDVMKERWERSL